MAECATQLHIGRVAHPPTLDDFENDGMTRVEGFLDRIPTNLAPISERTIAYVGYDDAALYVVFAAFDSEAAKLRARLITRDRIPSDDDTVAIFLDTFHDRKRCYGFQMNARGVQSDAIWTEAGGVWDFSFDAVWQSEARLTSSGYVARFAIPFKSLRFPPTSMQNWGFFLYRGIPRKNEEAYWPSFSREVAGRLNQAADLVGLDSVSPGRNVQFIPYASFLGARTSAVRTSDAQSGADAKIIIGDSIVADATINPDFSQVESDEPQETVNQRFEVFFPEKRPFFIENASYFETPLQLLFTRRIADPQHGVKVTGKAGRYGIGALVIDDQAPGERALPGDALRGKSAGVRALRLTRDIGTDSSIGGILVARSLAGNTNSIGGADARLRLSPNWFAMLQGVGGSGTALHGSFIGSGTNTSYRADLDDLSPDFRADVGFIARVGIQQAHQTMSYRWRPQGKTLISWGPDFITNDVYDRRGGWLEHSYEPKLTLELPRLTTIAVAVLDGRQRIIPREFAGLSRPVSLDDRRWGVEVTTSALPKTSLYAEYIGGRSINFVSRAPINGELRQIVTTLEVHPTDRWTWQNNAIYTGIESSFTHRIVRSKISYQFSLPLSIRAIVTDDHLSVNPLSTRLRPGHRLNADFLMTYLLSPGTALYAGYNTNYAADDTIADLQNDHRQVFIKISYLVRF